MSIFLGWHCKLDIGEREYKLPPGMGEVARCSIKGMRGRDYELVKMQTDELNTHAKDLRGVPTAFSSDAGTLRVWPVPDRDMMLLVECGTVDGREPPIKVHDLDRMDKRTRAYKEAVGALRSGDE